MRTHLKLAIGVCALATAALGSVAANADPYFHRYDNGSWTNVDFNDGTCRYYFSHNSYDGQTRLNRYGDCSHVAIGPAGEPLPVIAGPVAVAPYGAPGGAALGPVAPYGAPY